MKSAIQFGATYLFQKNSFLRGMGSVLNIRGSYFNYKTSNTDLQADIKATESDWTAIGSDILESVSKFKSENSLK